MTHIERVTDLSTIMDDGAKAGFSWEYGNVSYEPENNGHKVSLGKQPYIRVTDVMTFDANFPGTLSGTTSVRVLCQGVTRRAELAARAGKPTSSDADKRRAILNSLRGVRTRMVPAGPQFVYHGITYTNLADVQSAEIAFLVEHGVDETVARTSVMKVVA